jgi:hypothetical protein
MFEKIPRAFPGLKINFALNHQKWRENEANIPLSREDFSRHDNVKKRENFRHFDLWGFKNVPNIC